MGHFCVDIMDVITRDIPEKVTKCRQNAACNAPFVVHPIPEGATFRDQWNDVTGSNQVPEVGVMDGATGGEAGSGTPAYVGPHGCGGRTGAAIPSLQTHHGQTVCRHSAQAGRWWGKLGSTQQLFIICRGIILNLKKGILVILI